MCPIDAPGAGLKTIAWNRISLTVPETWEIDGLSLNHMLLGDDNGSLLEARWETLHTSRSLESHVNRFVSQARKRLSMTVTPHRKPPCTVRPAGDVEMIWYSWEGAAHKGTGVFLFCRVCSCFSALRFFPGLEKGLDAVLDALLGSYRDHPAGGRTLWSVFGLDVSLDSRFDLKTFCFHPGSFSLDLATDCGVTLSLYSWGPASVLLSGIGLRDFAALKFKDLSGSPVPGNHGTRGCLEWTVARRHRELSSPLVRLFGKKARTSVIRILHDTGKNRIKGMRMDFFQGIAPHTVREFADVRF